MEAIILGNEGRTGALKKLPPKSQESGEAEFKLLEIP